MVKCLLVIVICLTFNPSWASNLSFGQKFRGIWGLYCTPYKGGSLKGFGGIFAGKMAEENAFVLRVNIYKDEKCEGPSELKRIGGYGEIVSEVEPPNKYLVRIITKDQSFNDVLKMSIYRNKIVGNKKCHYIFASTLNENEEPIEFVSDICEKTDGH